MNKNLVAGRVLTENGFSVEFENEVLKAAASKDLSPVFHNAKELINYLDAKR